MGEQQLSQRLMEASFGLDTMHGHNETDDGALGRTYVNLYDLITCASCMHMHAYIRPHL